MGRFSPVSAREKRFLGWWVEETRACNFLN